MKNLQRVYIYDQKESLKTLAKILIKQFFFSQFKEDFYKLNFNCCFFFNFKFIFYDIYFIAFPKMFISFRVRILLTSYAQLQTYLMVEIVVYLLLTHEIVLQAQFFKKARFPMLIFMASNYN